MEIKAFGIVITPGCDEIKKRYPEQCKIITYNDIICVNKEIDKSLHQNKDEKLLGYYYMEDL